MPGASCGDSGDIDDDLIHEREQCWIEHYRAMDMPLTNIREVSSSPSGGEGVVRIVVKEIASSRNISMSRLSRMSDVDLTTLRKIYQHPTSSNVTLETLIKLASALQIDIRKLLEPITAE
jgi:hypothetical protein